MLKLDGKQYILDGDKSIPTANDAFRSIYDDNHIDRVPVRDRENKVIYLVDAMYLDDGDDVLTWGMAVPCIVMALREIGGWRCIRS